MASLNTIHDSVQVEPLKQWPEGYPRAETRQSSRFERRGILDRTIRDLRHELRQLDVDQVVLQVEVPPLQIRKRDGLPYKNADIDPGVVLTLEMEGGAVQTYPCDTFHDWQANLRAIALALHDLRRISRYGVGRGSEQYRGYTALPEDVDDRIGPEEAARILVSTAGWRSSEDFERRVETCLEDESEAASYLREARKKSHPDMPTGNEASFKRVQRAGHILEQRFNGRKRVES